MSLGMQEADELFQPKVKTIKLLKRLLVVGFVSGVGIGYLIARFV